MYTTDNVMVWTDQYCSECTGTMNKDVMDISQSSETEGASTLDFTNLCLTWIECSGGSWVRSGLDLNNYVYSVGI